MIFRVRFPNNEVVFIGSSAVDVTLAHNDTTLLPPPPPPQPYSKNQG